MDVSPTGQSITLAQVGSLHKKNAAAKSTMARAVDLFINHHKGGHLQWTLDNGQVRTIADEDALITSLAYSSQSSLLAVGCAFGGMALLSLIEGDVLFFVSPGPCSGRVSTMTFAEPENDPKPTLYLWAAFDASVDQSHGPGQLWPARATMFSVQFERKSPKLFDGRTTTFYDDCATVCDLSQLC